MELAPKPFPDCLLPFSSECCWWAPVACGCAGWWKPNRHNPGPVPVPCGKRVEASSWCRRWQEPAQKGDSSLPLWSEPDMGSSPVDAPGPSTGPTHTPHPSVLTPGQDQALAQALLSGPNCFSEPGPDPGKAVPVRPQSPRPHPSAQCLLPHWHHPWSPYPLPGSVARLSSHSPLQLGSDNHRPRNPEPRQTLLFSMVRECFKPKNTRGVTWPDATILTTMWQQHPSMGVATHQMWCTHMTKDNKGPRQISGQRTSCWWLGLEKNNNCICTSHLLKDRLQTQWKFKCEV